VLRHSAFTLVELMIVIAIAMVLVVIIQGVFVQASQVVGRGQKLSQATRDLMAVQAQVKKDLEGAALSDGPFFMIRSSAQVAFAHARDHQSDADYAATASPGDVPAILSADPENTGTEQPQAVTHYGTRTFRQDTLAFFSRGVFERYGGNGGILPTPMRSHEAFIWYGHLRLPDDAALPAFQLPGLTDGMHYTTARTNPNNFYASQWILGRMAILLREPQPRHADDHTGSASDQVIYCDPPWPAGGTDPRWTTHVRQVYLGAEPNTLAPLEHSARATQDGRSYSGW